MSVVLPTPEGPMSPCGASPSRRTRSTPLSTSSPGYPAWIPAAARVARIDAPIGKGALSVHPYLNADDPRSKTDAHPRVQIPAVLGCVVERLAAHHALRRPDPEEISKLEQDSFKTGRLKRGSVVSQSSHVTAAFRLRARYWFGWRSGVPLRPFGRGISPYMNPTRQRVQIATLLIDRGSDSWWQCRWKGSRSTPRSRHARRQRGVRATDGDGDR